MGIIAFIIAVLCLFKWKQAKYDKENFDANSSKYKSLNKRSKILSYQPPVQLVVYYQPS